MTVDWSHAYLLKLLWRGEGHLQGGTLWRLDL